MRIILSNIRKRFLGAIGIVFFLYLLYGNITVPNLLIYNHTESIPIGWYLRIPIELYGDIQIGDIVGYDVPDHIREMAIKRCWLKETDIMMKKVGALTKDSFEIRDDKTFWVRNQYIGNVYEFDSKNQSMPMMNVGKHEVGKDEFLPVTKHPYSFDGRYYGVIKINKIKFVAIPLTAFHF